jgi:hypothetical protein
MSRFDDYDCDEYFPNHTSSALETDEGQESIQGCMPALRSSSRCRVRHATR